jgi:hypothetical protein
MPRQGPRFVVAMLACAMTVGCTQDSPLGSSDPVTPPRADLLRSAVRIHVDLVQGTAVAVSPDARSASAAGLSLALVGRNELRADVIGDIRRSAVGEFTKKKVRVSMDVALTNLLTNAAFVAPSFPTTPAGTSGVLLFPFATTVTAGSGNVAPSPDWDGAPINFFNDTDAGCSLYKSDCYRWEAYPAPLTGGSSTGAQTVGFDVDPSVTAFDTYYVLAADLSSLGVVAGQVLSAPFPGGPQTPAPGATVTLDLFVAGGGTLGQLVTTTDANGNYRFLDVPPNSPFPFGSGFSAENGDGYLLKVVAPVCGGTRDGDNSGMLAVQAGRTGGASFIFNCSA